MNHALRLLFHCTPLTDVPSLCICGPSRFVCLEYNHWVFYFNQGRTMLTYLADFSRLLSRHVEDPLPRSYFFLPSRPPAYEPCYWPPA